MSDREHTCQCDHDSDATYALIRRLLPDGSPSLFALVQAVQDVLRYQEAWRLYGVLKELQHNDEGSDLVFYRKHGDGEPLSHAEVWDRAIEEVLLVLDGELGGISGSGF